MSEVVNEQVFDDGSGTKLAFWKPHPSDDFFHFVIADEGGYTSALMTKAQWEETKVKMDKLIAEHMK